MYTGVTGWKSFEPWLSRVENLPADRLWTIAEAVPPEWYGGDLGEIEQLMEQLLKRRNRIRDFITAFHHSNREPFPNWAATVSVVAPRQFAEMAPASKLVM